MSGNMSAKQQSDLVADTSKNIKQDDKCGLYESSRTDSGFLSGGNLVLSGEIVSEEDIEPRISTDKQQMHIDSGLVCLSETFSSLGLKNPDLNDLGSKEFKREEKILVAKVEEQPWEVYYEQDEDGDTQLHNAIIHGYPDVALALIRMAPHPRLLDTPNDDAQSPLHLAVALGQHRVARWLIVAGARPSPRNLLGDSPLHVAAATGDVNCCAAILNPVRQTERTELSLKYAVAQRCHELDVEQWNYDGKTCVHVAAMNGHVDVLRHLVWYGADINAREGKGGYTALHYAMARGDEALVRFLLTECSQLNPAALTYGGRSALELGLTVQDAVRETLLARGVPTPYSSEDEEESSDDEMLQDSVGGYFVPNMVNATA